MHQGWIKLHRKLQDSQMYKALNSKQRDVMIQCLMLANHQEASWLWCGELYTCKPGQFITSLLSISEKCATSVKVQSVRTALLKLEKWGFLTNQSTKTGRLITIVNWDTYQDKEIETNKAPNKELTKHQQSANKALTTNKNVKNKKNIKKKTFEKNSIEFILSSLLLNEILKRKPDHRKPNLQAWSKEVDSMIRLDHRQPNRIREVILWCQADCGNGKWKGWQDNIRSTAKLREKFDTLELQMVDPEIARKEKSHRELIEQAKRINVGRKARGEELIEF